MNDKPSDSTASEFEPVSDPAWVVEVDSWQWVMRTPEEYIKQGKCKHCGHQMSVVSGTVLGAMRVDQHTLPKKPARCNCTVAHPGSPDPDAKGQGCGRHGLIERPPE